MTGSFGELRQAVRALARTPAFTAVAVMTLALGIGANAAVFSILHAVLLRPLPYHDPGGLVFIESTNSLPNVVHDGSTSYRDFEFLQAHDTQFEDLTVFFKRGWSMATLEGPEPARIQAAHVSGELFTLMGVPPALGRVFGPREATSGERVAVLSYGLWQRRFGGSPEALGKTIRISGTSLVVIGVMPPGFEFPHRNVQLWSPVTAHWQWDDHSEPRLLEKERWKMAARLQPGVSIQQAQAELNSIASALRRAAPDTHDGFGLRAVPIQDEFVAGARRGLLTLFGAVGLVLLIACANLASLFLARTASQGRDLAVRTALGAGRTDLMRKVILESIAVSFPAAALGLALAAPAMRLLVSYAPADISRLGDASLNLPVLAFTFAIAFLGAMLFAAIPAWRASRADPSQALYEHGRSASASRAARRAHRVFIIAEFALAMTLVTAAGLLLRSYFAVLSIDPGFRPEHVLTSRISRSGSGAAQFSRQALARIRSLPGVIYAGAASNLFYLDESRTHALRQVEGRAPEPVSSWKPLVWTQVTPQYFEAMGIPLRAGRYIDEHDTAASPTVAVVNETLARRYWPGESAIGKRLRGFDPRGRNDDWLTVVGVVADTHSGGIDREAMAQIYEPQSQRQEAADNLVIRAASDPLRLAAAAREAVRSVDPSAIILSVSTMEDVLRDQTARRRFETWMLTIFSALALTLAAIGIYGTTYYAVSDRRREIGIRAALGAKRSDLFGMMLRDALKSAATGLVLGLIGAMWAQGAISSLLFRVKPADPVTIASGSALLIATTVLAAAIPAGAATRVDPVETLRCE